MMGAFVSCRWRSQPGAQGTPPTWDSKSRWLSGMCNSKCWVQLLVAGGGANIVPQDCRGHPARSISVPANPSTERDRGSTHARASTVQFSSIRHTGVRTVRCGTVRHGLPAARSLTPTVKAGLGQALVRHCSKHLAHLGRGVGRKKRVAYEQGGKCWMPGHTVQAERDQRSRVLSYTCRTATRRANRHGPALTPWPRSCIAPRDAGRAQQRCLLHSALGTHLVGMPDNTASTAHNPNVRLPFPPARPAHRCQHPTQP